MCSTYQQTNLLRLKIKEMKAKTIIQTINTSPYIDIAVLDFLYTPETKGSLFLDDKKVIINEIYDKIDLVSETLIRRIRLYILD